MLFDRTDEQIAEQPVERSEACALQTPRYVSKTTRRILLAAAGLLAPGCATLSNHSSPQIPIEENEKVTGAENEKLNMEVAVQAQKFPYSAEAFQEYISQFSEGTWKALDNSFKKLNLKDPQRVIKFLIKYKVPLEKINPQDLPHFLTIITMAAEGLSFSVDALEQAYGMPADLDRIKEVIGFLKLEDEAYMRAISSSLSGKKEAYEKPEIRGAYFAVARIFAEGVCRPEIVEFVKKFEAEVGKKGQMGMQELNKIVQSFSNGKVPQKTGEAWPKFEVPPREWDKFKTAANSARELLGDLFDPQALIISVIAYKQPRFLENLRLLKKENVIFSKDKQITLDDWTFLGEVTLDPGFASFLGWVTGALNSSVDSAGLSSLQAEYKDLELGNIPLTEELKGKLVQEVQKYPKIQDFGLILLYLVNQEGIDHLREVHGLDFDTGDNLKDLIKVYLDYIKDPKNIAVEAKPHGKDYLRKFDIYEKEGRVETLLAIFARGHRAHEKYMAGSYDKDHNPLDQRTKDFRRACAYVSNILKTWTDDEINSLIKLGLFANFEATVEDLKREADSIKGILMPLSRGKGPATCDHIIATHQAFLGDGEMTADELRALYNMDSQKRENYQNLANGMRAIYKYTGVSFTSKMLAELVEQESFTARLLYLFFDVKDGELKPKEEVFARVSDFFRSFGLAPEIKNPGDLLIFSELANKLWEVPERIDILEKLFNRFGTDIEGRKSFLMSLYIFTNAEKGAEDMDKYFKLFADEEKLLLYDAVQVAYNIHTDVDELMSSQYAQPEELLNDEVIAWINEQAAAYSAKLKNYGGVNSFYNYYKDTELRAFLATEGARAFFKESAERGKEYGIYELDDMAKDYKNRKLLPYGARLREGYDIDPAPSKGLLDFSMSFGRGEVDEIAYLQTLERYGFLADLENPETLANFKKLTKSLKIPIDRKGLLSFLQLNRNPEVFKKLVSKNFVKFCKQFKSDNSDFPIHSETLESLLEAYETQGLSSAVSKIQSKFGKEMNIKTTEDLDAGILIAKTPRLLSSILQPAFAAYWEAAKQRNPGLSFADIVTVFGWQEEKVDFDSLYEQYYEEFLTRVLQKKNISLQERRSLRKYYDDEDLQDKLTSEDFKKTVGSLHMAESHNAMSSDDVEVVLFFMDHPELVEGTRGGDSAFSMLFSDRLEEGDGYVFHRIFLPSYLLLKQDPKVGKYMGIMAKTLPYTHHVSDGLVIKELTERYPDEVAFESLCKEIALHLNGGEKNIRLNDLFLSFQDDELNFNREELEAQASRAFSNDLHRTDSNFFSYTSYNDLSKLNIIELNKVVRLQQALAGNSGLRQSIGNGIRKDIEKDLVTELGGLVRFNANENVAFDYITPSADGSNGAYRPSQDHRNMAAGSGMTFHQHATTWKDSKYASPSGSLFKKGADIGNAKMFASDGATVTSLSEGKFAVHFYTDRGNVAYVGTFEYELPKKPPLCQFPALSSPHKVIDCVVETVKRVLGRNNQQ